MRHGIAIESFKRISVLSVSVLALSACSIASGYSQSEQEIVSSMDSSRYQPATRQVRDNIETQDNFAQAAFWSQEYQLNPADLEASIKLASAVRKMGNPSKAIEITQTTRALHPNDPYLAAEYAAALIASERGEEAISSLDTALRAAPGYARLWSLKGAALDQMENYDLARRHYARALQITPNDPNIMTNMGLSYALAGDARQAEGWLRQAASQPGAGANTRQNLDLIMQLQGKGNAAPQTSQQRAPDVRDFEYVPNSRNNQQQQQPYNGYRQAPNAQHAAQQPLPQNAQSQPQARGYYTPPAAAQTNNGYRPTPQQQAYRPQVAQQPAPQGYRRQPQSDNRQQSRSRAQQRQAAPLQQAPQSQLQTPQYRSSMTVSGNEAGAPKSASDMARAVASQSQGQNRRVVGPVAPTQKTPEQLSILDQIARNVGPRPTGQQAAVRPTYPQSQSNAVQDYPPPETLRRRPNPYYAQNTPVPPQGYNNGYSDPQQAQQQPYAQSGAPQTQSRGSARRRR